MLGEAVAGEVAKVSDLLKRSDEKRSAMVCQSALHAGNGALERLEEVRAVDEPGERIMHRCAPQLLLGALPGADVRHRARNA